MTKYYGFLSIGTLFVWLATVEADASMTPSTTGILPPSPITTTTTSDIISISSSSRRRSIPFFLSAPSSQVSLSELLLRPSSNPLWIHGGDQASYPPQQQQLQQQQDVDDHETATLLQNDDTNDVESVHSSGTYTSDRGKVLCPSNSISLHLLGCL